MRWAIGWPQNGNGMTQKPQHAISTTTELTRHGHQLLGKTLLTGITEIAWSKFLITEEEEQQRNP